VIIREIRGLWVVFLVIVTILSSKIAGHSLFGFLERRQAWISNLISFSVDFFVDFLLQVSVPFGLRDFA
jgi:hypothetical protein